MILCADSLHDDGVSVWARDDDAEGALQETVVWGSRDPLTVMQA